MIPACLMSVNIRLQNRRAATSEADESSFSRKSCLNQMTKLLSEGQTDLLTSFVSQRTHRPFKAYLAMGKDGKIGFKFEETTGKAAGAKRKMATAAKAKTSTTKTASKSTTKTAAKTPAKKTTVKKTTTRKTATKKKEE